MSNIAEDGSASPYNVFIYALCDPDEPVFGHSVRYVGKSIDPEGRYRRHIREAQSSTRDNYRLRWLRSLLREGKAPKLSTLEITSAAEWQEREQWWITLFRKTPCRLTNGTDGGEGIHNPTPETLANLSAAHLGQRAWNKGLSTGPQSPEVIASRAQAHARTWIVTSPRGRRYVVHNLKQFCRGTHLHASGFYQDGKSHGWKAERA